MSDNGNLGYSYNKVIKCLKYYKDLHQYISNLDDGVFIQLSVEVNNQSNQINQLQKKSKI